MMPAKQNLWYQRSSNKITIKVPRNADDVHKVEGQVNAMIREITKVLKQLNDVSSEEWQRR